MEKELIKELWKLWEDLAETGELHINKDFPNKYNELKKKVDKTRKINRIKSQKSYWFETLSLFVDGCLTKEECKQYQNELAEKLTETFKNK